MSKTILELRELLAKTSPAWKTGAEITPLKSKACWPTGWPRWDEALDGGLPSGAITEWVIPVKGMGGASLIRRLLGQCHRTGGRMALIDGLDSFDPSSCEESILSRLLWVRCRNADESLKAADLLLRDGNVPLVALDLALNPAPQLRKIPPTTWYRFQRVIERTATLLLVITPSALVSSAQLRVVLQGTFSLELLAQSEERCLSELTIGLHRGESQHERPLELEQLA